MMFRTHYPNTVAMSNEELLEVHKSEYVDIFNSRSNRHMARITKEHIPQFADTAVEKVMNAYSDTGRLVSTAGPTYGVEKKKFWRLTIPKQCEITED